MSTLQDTLSHRRGEEEPHAHTCYSADERMPTVIVEATDRNLWILPWSQFVSGRHFISGKREHLTLLFASYEVAIEGTRLDILMPEIARFRLCSLRSLPSKYELHGDSSEPFIDRLGVMKFDSSHSEKTDLS